MQHFFGQLVSEITIATLGSKLMYWEIPWQKDTENLDMDIFSSTPYVDVIKHK